MAARPLYAGWLLLACVFIAAPSTAQDAKAGRDKARKCVVCHGVDGIAVTPNAPNLAGENAVYIVAQLKAFRSGKRTHEQMSIIASKLNNEDIRDLARWYSLIKVVATPPVLD